MKVGLLASWLAGSLARTDALGLQFQVVTSHFWLVGQLAS
jgi:hypothetical protein